ncbi:MAG: hypothetical protein WC369_04470 [Dehalococcoidales bacterium]
MVEKEKVTVEYKLPIPSENQTKRESVLPTVTFGGAEVSIGRTGKDFNFTFDLSI